MSGDVKPLRESRVPVPVLLLATFEEPPPPASGFSTQPIPPPQGNPKYNTLFTDWASRKLDLSPEAFDKRVYAFEVKGDGPLPAVTLNGHPEVEIPWTDPYLLAEWESFLLSAGLRREVESRGDGIRVLYQFNGTKLVELLNTENSLEFRFFSRSGRLLFTKTLPKPKRDPVVVKFPDPKDSLPQYKMTVSGCTFKATAFFPAHFNEDEKLAVFTSIGQALRRIPLSRLHDFANGLENEPPLELVVATQEKAKEMEFYREGSGGMYFSDSNQTWVQLYPSGKVVLSTLIHEIAGHGDDDFEKSDDNDAFMTGSRTHRIKDYYDWKLNQCFSRQEIATYMRASRDFHKKDRDPNSPSLDVAMLRRDLADFRKKALQCFVSTYAVEGPGGIKAHLAAPYEYYAEAVESFYRTVLFEEEGSQQSFHELRERDPFLTLIGIDYLMDQYGVETVGSVRRDELYTDSGFKTILGVSLDSNETVELEQIDEETGRELPGARWAIRRHGAMGQIRVGGGMSQVETDAHSTERSDVVTFGVMPGYRWDWIAGGVALDYRHLSGKDHSHDGFDIGLWGQLLYEKGRVAFFLEPEAGVALMTEGKDRAAYWGGIGVGAMFEGVVSATVAGKAFRGDGYREEGVEGIVGLDLYHLLYRVRGWGR